MQNQIRTLENSTAQNRGHSTGNQIAEDDSQQEKNPTKIENK